MVDHSDLFTLARNTDAFNPSTEALADPFYVQKLNRLQGIWIELVDLGCTYHFVG